MDPQAAPPETPSRSGFWARFARAHGRRAAVLGLLVGAGFALRELGLADSFGAIRAELAELGPAGPWVFAGLYAAATVAAVPGSILSVAAGALFGPWAGVAAVWAGATLGACGAFAVSRWLARGATLRWVSKRGGFLSRFERLLERHGAVVVLAVRLVPVVPFNLANYAFGLTRVSFRTYAWATAVGILPGTVVYVLGAAAATEGVLSGSVPWGLVGMAVLAGLLLAWLAARWKSRLLPEGRANGGQPGASESGMRSGSDPTGSSGFLSED